MNNSHRLIILVQFNLSPYMAHITRAQSGQKNTLWESLTCIFSCSLLPTTADGSTCFIWHPSYLWRLVTLRGWVCLASQSQTRDLLHVRC